MQLDPRRAEGESASPQARAALAEQLRARREAAGLDLGGLSDQTRILRSYLEAIERGELDCLPPGLYRRNFVRTYLQAIGLRDSREIEAAVSILVGEAREPVASSTAQYLTAARTAELHGALRPALALAGVVLLLGAGWLLASRVFRDAPRGGEAGASSAAPEARAPDVPLGDTSAATVAGSGQAIAPEPDPRVEPEPPLTSTPVDAQTPPDVEPGQARTAVLRATQKVWLKIEPASGDAREMVLRPGETHVIALDGPARVLLGNAGGVELSIDGRPAPPLGQPGEVRKFVIDPSDLSAVFDPAPTPGPEPAPAADEGQPADEAP